MIKRTPVFLLTLIALIGLQNVAHSQTKEEANAKRMGADTFFGTKLKDLELQSDLKAFTASEDISDVEKDLVEKANKMTPDDKANCETALGDAQEAFTKMNMHYTTGGFKTQDGHKKLGIATTAYFGTPPDYAKCYTQAILALADYYAAETQFNLMTPELTDINVAVNAAKAILSKYP